MILISILLLTFVVYLYLRYVYSYWKRNGFEYIPPSIPFGNLGLVAARKESFGVNIYTLYKQSTQPFVGIYMLFKPALLVRDATLARKMLSVDFNSFHDRGIYCNPKYDPLSENMFAMTGHRWKALRSKLTPTFTSGKLKNMLPIIMVEGDRVMNHLEPMAQKGEVVQMKDLMSRYALNVIGSVIFGLDVDTISNPNDSFREIERQINSPDLVIVIKAVSVFLCPKVLEFFNLNSMPRVVQDFMMNIVKKQIEYREQNHVFRKDFIQFLIQLRNTGTINEDDAVWDVETTSDALKNMSIEQCAAQVFLFYVAGFDTSASTSSYALYELAKNPDLQRKLQVDIETTLAKHDNQLTYECILEMKYLELCLLETIRKYPALPILNRECTEDYPIPETDFVIKKGTAIVISLLGISRDPEYFPDPETFRPERFSDPIPEYVEDAYIPFGDGPRACIGLRLGKMVVKIGLIKLLQKYNFELVDDKPLEFDVFNVTLQVKGGINLRVTNRTST